jgi:BirA family transcriptional regulator, biotin operon repressor / biotin---[acetyl-CoA-carboxylase] ligase
VAEVRWDGHSAFELAERTGASHVSLHERTTSTLDVAHALAQAGAPAGTLVLAEEQTGGRGRAGRAWASPPGTGIWLTLLERPRDESGLAVLSLRAGLRAAEALAPFAGERVRLKWPNDLYLAAGKLAGILVEARWREARAEWVAIGFGLNVVAPPGVERAAGLPAGTSRAAVLAALVPALRAAAASGGALRDEELSAYGERDLARGRRLVEPVVGTAVGLDPDGALVVAGAGGVERLHRGSLVLADGVW